MPSYDFKCPKCNKVIEINRSSTKTEPIICEECKVEMERQYFALRSSQIRVKPW